MLRRKGGRSNRPSFFVATKRACDPCGSHLLGVFFVALLARRYTDGKPVLVWGQWACRIVIERARWVIRLVKIDGCPAIAIRCIRIKKSPATVCFQTRSAVGKNNEQLFRTRFAQRVKTVCLTVDLEHNRAKYPLVGCQTDRVVDGNILVRRIRLEPPIDPPPLVYGEAFQPREGTAKFDCIIV